MEDKVLYQQFLEGDESAFEQIISKYRTGIIYFLNRFTRNLDSSEDIFQDTITYIIEHKEAYNSDYSFKSFLYMIAKSKALDFIKHERITDCIDGKDYKDEKLIEDIVFARLEYEEIKNMIEELSEDYQMAIYLSQIEGFSYSETAKIMNKTEKQIKLLVHRARKQLKEKVRANKQFNNTRKVEMMRIVSFKERGVNVKKSSMFKLFIILIMIILVSSGIVYAVVNLSKNSGKVSMTPNYASKISTIDTNKVWVGTFNLVWNDFMNDVVKGNIEFEDGNSELANDLNKQTFKDNQLSTDSYFKIHGNSSIELKSKIENNIKQKFNDSSTIIDKIDWSDENGYILYAMLKKEFNFIEPFSTATESIDFNNTNTKIKSFGVDNMNNPVAGKNVDILFYNSKDDFAIKLKTKEGEEVILYKTSKTDKSFNEYYQEINEQQNNYTGKSTFENTDRIIIPFIQVSDEINYDELCGRYIKGMNNNYIKQAMQTIDFELNNVGGSVKSEAMVNMPQSEEVNAVREMIFDSNFIVFLKEENKEQPYFALKVDNVDILVPDESGINDN